MAENTKKLISFIVPVYNEEANIVPLHEAVVEAMAPLEDRYDYEFVFTDNHSTDRTFEELAKLAEKDPRIRVVRFSRNFGYQKSILTGYFHARGDAAVQLDADLQDPPALVPELITLWEKGNQVVYGVRRSRKEAWWINWVRHAFYVVIDSLSEDELPRDAGDFRLIDRRAIDELKKFEDSQPYIRGTLATMGFSQVGFPYDRDERKRGKGKFSFTDLMNLAVDGILNHSVVPLRLATYMGLAVAVVTFMMLMSFLVRRILFGHDWPPGFATLIITILFSLSLNAIFFGIIGEYLGRMYKQIKKRPLTIVEREIPPRGEA